MAQITLSARIREAKGKGAARKLRRANQIPAIFYGPNAKPVKLAVNYSDLHGILKQTAGENIILGLEIESDSGRDTRTVMLKELQTDPIEDIYFHADFYEISMDKEITVEIPIRLINTPIGVTNGGILQHVRRDVTCSCLPDKLIDVLELDVSGLDIGGSLHARDLELPEGITSLEEDHLTIAVVAAPTVVEEEVVEEEVEEEGVEEEGAETKAESAEESQDKEKGGEG
jgi:large subunit ribosomal protein L25